MNILDTCFKIMKLLEMAHEMLQTLPEGEHRDNATANLESAHGLVQDKIKPIVDAQ